MALANTTESTQVVTLYHQAAGATDDPEEEDVVSVRTVAPLSTATDPEQGSTGITMQIGDVLSAKVETFPTPGVPVPDETTPAAFAPTLIGSENFTVTDANWDHGANAITVPAATAYDWLMLRIKGSVWTGHVVAQNLPGAIFKTTDFDALTAGSNDSSVSSGTYVSFLSIRGRNIGPEATFAYCGMTSSRRLLFASVNFSNMNPTPLELWGFAAETTNSGASGSAAIELVSGLVLSIYVIPQNTAPLGTPYVLSNG